MEVDISSNIIALIILLILSAFFSSSETALTSVSRIKLETLVREDEKLKNKAARTLKVIDDRAKMLSAILIGNNLVNIAASAMATALAIDLFGSAGIGIATGVLTLLILVFGEITPKSIAAFEATWLSLRVSGVILVLMWVLTPIIYILNLSVVLVRKIFKVSDEDEESKMTSEELKTVINISHEAGEIEEDEKEYIVNVFDFSDSVVKEVMTPRIDITLLKKDITYEELLNIFKENMYTRYPVCTDNPDEIIGIFNVKDLILFDKEKEFDITEHLRESYFTFEHKNTAELFDEMRLSSIAMAIVLDEYGDIAGLVTLEDLLEELVGEIRDEYDADEVDDITKLSDREFEVLGGANLDDVCDDLPLNFESDDYDTIGGYLTGLFDHFPKTGETYVTEDGIILRVIAVKKSRIEKIRIRFPQNVEF